MSGEIYVFGDQSSCWNIYKIMVLPELNRIKQKMWILFQFSSGPQVSMIWTKIHIFLLILSASDKFMVCVFYGTKVAEYMKCELSSIFVSQTGFQKYSAWVIGSPMPNSLCSVMSISKFCASLVYVKEKWYFRINWVFHFVGPRGSIPCNKVAEMFHVYEV